jgi:hypothetical protein
MLPPEHAAEDGIVGRPETPGPIRHLDRGPVRGGQVFGLFVGEQSPHSVPCDLVDLVPVNEAMAVAFQVVHSDYDPVEQVELGDLKHMLNFAELLATL